MNLTWHIVKKDFLRLRLPLALWVALMAGQFILSYQILHVVNPDPAALQLTLHTLDRMKDVLFGLQIFLCCLLVAALIQEDPLVGQQAWWVTRPISGARLLGAKLIALVLFFWVLPVLVSLPWWLYSGYDARALSWGIIQLLEQQVAVTWGVLALAVLTANAARFLALVLLLIFTGMCCFIMLLAHSPDRTLGVVQTRSLAGLVWALGAIGLVVIHQFLTRRSGRSWAIFAAGCLLLLTLANSWPWDWSNWALWRGSEPPALKQVTVTPGEVAFTKAGSNEDPSLVRMELGLRFAHLPGDYELSLGYFTGTLRWADGMERTRTGWIRSYSPMTAWRIMGLQTPAGVPPERWQESMQSRGDRAMSLRGDLAMSLIPRSLATKLQQVPPTWDGDLTLYPYRGEIVAEVPLREGETGGRRGHQIHIMSIEHPESGGLVVKTAESFPLLAGETLPVLLFPGIRGGPPPRDVLASQDRTKFIELRPYAEVHTLTDSVMLLRQNYGCDAKQLANPNDPHWLDRAVLLKVAFHPEGTLLRHVHSDGLVETEASQKRVPLPVIKPKPAPGS